ncbi:hypothetical protein NLG97_g2327 [Lecanicillium saksenae]|uniref:Uncharacterized protein n=1 Tax=Lecanicillium saksenae TaxID=468837 RepID=A0ACC1R183_9HYPO|nr:hypothetical protein NLG97_g2327 [Lecanicillium saksenae]
MQQLWHATATEVAPAEQRLAVAVAAPFVLPDFPRTTPWLSEKEVSMAVWRLEHDIGEDDWVSREQQTFYEGTKAAVKDPKAWILAFILFGNISAASVVNFFPSVVSTLKYSKVTTLLLTTPPYVLAVATMLLNAWHADRTGERFWHISLPLCVAIATCVIAASTTNVAARYASMMLMIPGLYTGFTTALAWISNTLPRPPAKRAAALGFINALSNSPAIYTSYLYPAKAAPQYEAAFIHNCLMAVMTIVLAGVLRTMLVRLNKKLDRGEPVDGVLHIAPGEAVKNGFRFLL